MGRNNADFRTEYDSVSGSSMTKPALQARDGWVSAWPGPQVNGGRAHPNWSANVGKAEQTTNTINANRSRNEGEPGPSGRTMTGA